MASKGYHGIVHDERCTQLAPKTWTPFRTAWVLLKIVEAVLPGTQSTPLSNDTGMLKRFRAHFAGFTKNFACACAIFVAGLFYESAGLLVAAPAGHPNRQLWDEEQVLASLHWVRGLSTKTDRSRSSEPSCVLVRGSNLIQHIIWQTDKSNSLYNINELGMNWQEFSWNKTSLLTGSPAQRTTLCFVHDFECVQSPGFRRFCFFELEPHRQHCFRVCRASIGGMCVPTISGKNTTDFPQGPRDIRQLTQILRTPRLSAKKGDVSIQVGCFVTTTARTSGFERERESIYHHSIFGHFETVFSYVLLAFCMHCWIYFSTHEIVHFQGVEEIYIYI